MTPPRSRHLAAFAASALLAVAAMWAVFVYAPRERVMGEIQRIFYIHVALAWVGIAAFVVLFAASGLYLWNGRASLDRLAQATAETGVLFATLVLVTGSLWARGVWGSWWVWDPRLTSSLVLWMLYAAYLALRRQVRDPLRRMRFSAVYAIIAFLDVPVVFFSIRWWRGQHPEAVGMAPEMLYAVLAACAACTALGVLVVSLRAGTLKLEHVLEGLQAELRERGNGS